MKSQLYAFLLFLLLLNQSLSSTDAARIPKTKPSKWPIKKSSVPTWWKRIKKLVKKNGSPQPTQIDGLSDIKQYLSNYGYILSSGPFDDSYDQDTISAIKKFQQYFNLPVTGDLNNQTIQLMSLPRCGVPDINFDYNFTDDVSYPKSGHRWFKGNNLTYGFLPASQVPLNVTNVFKDSFTRWANATGVLNLMETDYDKADIKIGFYNFSYFGIDDEVYGVSLILLLSPSGVKIGGIFLDANTWWWALPSQNEILSWEDGILDLESAAMHQIGHLLGLDHSNQEDSIMYPYVLPYQQRKVNLSKSDKDNIQRQY